MINYSNLGEYEETVVTLKCVEQEYMWKNGIKSSSSLYKITKKIKDEKPYRLYGSRPDFSKKNNPPYLIGINEDSDEGKKIKSKFKEHFYPEWYVFVTPTQEKIIEPTPIPFLIYINRETLKIESKIINGDEQLKWSDGTCSIVSNDEFYNDWDLQVKNKINKLKF